jgi:hypothetical protein
MMDMDQRRKSAAELERHTPVKRSRGRRWRSLGGKAMNQGGDWACERGYYIVDMRMRRCPQERVPNI